MAGSPVKLSSFGSRRHLGLEALESRYLLAASPVMDSPPTEVHHQPELTISFAPDGTDISGARNRLHATLGADVDVEEWQAAILRAFHTWVQHIDLEVRSVSDSGQAFGSLGAEAPASGFGDVRIAAIPMSADVIAMSVPFHPHADDSWAGDILFNSRVEFGSAEEVFRVALHEAGHVLGLSHSDDPLSPMHSHGGLGEPELSGDDVAELRALFTSSFEEHSEPPTGPGYEDAVDLIYASHVDPLDDHHEHNGHDDHEWTQAAGRQGPAAVIFSGYVDQETAVQLHTLEVATTQLYDFSLVLPFQSDGLAELKATFYNSHGDVVLQLSPEASWHTVLLGPGSYTVEFRLLDNGAEAGVDFALRERQLAQYLGPEVVDPSGSPITPCIEGPGEFCYPDEIYSWALYIWVDDELEPSPAESDSPSWDWWTWYTDLFLAGPDA